MCKVKLNEKHTQRKQWPDAIVKHHIQYEQHCPIWTHDVYIHPQATGSGDGSSRSPWSHSVWSSEETSVNRWSQSQPTSSCKHHTSFREKEKYSAFQSAVTLLSSFTYTSVDEHKLRFSDKYLCILFPYSVTYRTVISMSVKLQNYWKKYILWLV